MTDRSMTAERFQMLADIHGGDITGWPEAERTGGTALAAASAPARAVLTAARALDAALDALDAEIAPPLPSALRARMLDDADDVLRAGQGAEILRPVFGRARWVGPMALAASALIGVVVGWSAPRNLAATLTPTSAVSAASWQGETFLTADLMPGDDAFAE